MKNLLVSAHHSFTATLEVDLGSSLIQPPHTDNIATPFRMFDLAGGDRHHDISQTSSSIPIDLPASIFANFAIDPYPRKFLRQVRRHNLREAETYADNSTNQYSDHYHSPSVRPHTNI